jgi:hypothetical protein
MARFGLQGEQYLFTSLSFPQLIHKCVSPGSPVHYIPLSRHAPDYVAELRTRQWELTLPEPWFPCPPLSKKPALCLGPCGLSTLDHLQEHSLVDAISAAMDTPLSLLIPLLPDAKTSHTHPIK